MTTLNTILKGRNYFYIMHLNYGDVFDHSECLHNREMLWKYARENKKIGLNHDFVEGSWYNESIRETAIAKGLPTIWSNQFDIFYNSMIKHDIVVILAGLDSILGVAEVKDEEPNYNPESEENFFPHTRKVCWIHEYTFGNRHMIPSVIGFVNTINRVEPDTERWRSLTAVRFT